MRSKIESIYRLNSCERICQGDIFSNLNIILYSGIDGEETHSEIDIYEIILPYAIILTQDCDLESDFNKRKSFEKKKLDASSIKQCYNKFIDSILICPAFSAEILRAGEHLKQMQMEVERINSKDWNKVKNNDNHRYHYLSSTELLNLDDETIEIPALAIDFKKFYTVPRDYLYIHRNNYTVSLNELVRENLSLRFANFQSRIGLPHLSK
jgi:hypothetical protein